MKTEFKVLDFFEKRPITIYLESEEIVNTSEIGKNIRPWTTYKLVDGRTMNVYYYEGKNYHIIE